MTKRELDLLGKVFEAEIDGALNKRPRLYQTKSKLAQKLTDEGYLEQTSYTFPGRFAVTITGYELTELGRLEYCISC